MKAKFGLTFRDLARKMGMRLFRKDVGDFFMGVVRDTIEYRERNKVNRNDFMDLLIKLKNAEPLKEGSENLGPLTFNEIAEQAFLFFFLAGFETSSTTLFYCMYELARNPDIQDKARKSVSEVLKQHGSMSYEAIQDMKYLEWCINGEFFVKTLCRMISNNSILFQNHSASTPQWQTSSETLP